MVHNDIVYIFGGTVQHHKQALNYSDQIESPLVSLDLKSYKWEFVQGRGEIPLTRDEHTACYYESSMVIFGGFLRTGERVNHIYRYYFRENKWELVKLHSFQNPSPRSGHSASIYQDRMFVFGGKDSDNEKLNDLWVFNFDDYKWEYLNLPNAPVGRSGHSSCIFNDKILIFGGIYEITKEMNDMHAFDIKNYKWSVFFDETVSPSSKTKAINKPQGFASAAQQLDSP